MRHLLSLLIAIIIGSTALLAQTKAGKTDSTQHSSFYSCPHHPATHSTHEGKCPIYDMNLQLSSKEQMKADASKTYTCPVHLDVTSHNAGDCPKCGKKMSLSLKEQMKAETVKLNTCPMHPTVALNKDGICPKCGKSAAAKKKSS